MNTFFRAWPNSPGAAAVYSTTLGPSNTIGTKPPVVGLFGVPGSWQQPRQAVPAPVPGYKGVLPDQIAVSSPARQITQFAPAPDYNPYGVY